MAISEATAEALALEIAEAVPAIRNFLGLPREDKLVVAKHLADKMIGSDPTAQLKSVPGMTPAVLEMVSDPILGLIAELLVGLLDGDDIPPTDTAT
jgi:hypothetical protein